MVTWGTPALVNATPLSVRTTRNERLSKAIVSAPRVNRKRSSGRTVRTPGSEALINRAVSSRAPIPRLRKPGRLTKSGAAPAEVKVNLPLPAPTVVVSTCATPGDCAIGRGFATWAGATDYGVTAGDLEIARAEVALSTDGPVARRGAPERRNIGAKMTSAARRSARPVRLSMQARTFAEAATERDHTRRAERGDSGQCDGSPTTCRVPAHVSRSPRSRMRSNSDNNDRTSGAAARG